MTMTNSERFNQHWRNAQDVVAKMTDEQVQVECRARGLPIYKLGTARKEEASDLAHNIASTRHLAELIEEREQQRSQ
jgi:hypothetical protein